MREERIDGGEASLEILEIVIRNIAGISEISFGMITVSEFVSKFILHQGIPGILRISLRNEILKVFSSQQQAQKVHGLSTSWSSQRH